jgi:hypothetical protein
VKCNVAVQSIESLSDRVWAPQTIRRTAVAALVLYVIFTVQHVQAEHISEHVDAIAIVERGYHSLRSNLGLGLLMNADAFLPRLYVLTTFAFADSFAEVWILLEVITAVATTASAIRLSF